MPGVRSVALAGSGRAGQAIIDALISAGVKITVLTRDVSKAQEKVRERASPQVVFAQVDYTCAASIEKAIRGHDAVISTLNVFSDLWRTQKRLIDASIAVGVKRFIPSDFSAGYDRREIGELPFYDEKFQTYTYLHALATAGKIEYTSIANGTFVDLSLHHPMFIDIKGHSIRLFDGGNVRFCGTRLATVGKATAAALTTAYDQSRNRVLKVREVVLTQLELLALAKEVERELAGPGDGSSRQSLEWAMSHVDTAELEKTAKAQAAADRMNVTAYHAVTLRMVFGYGNSFDQNDNALVGVESISREEVLDIIKRVFRS